jgi:hypothetical protein
VSNLQLPSFRLANPNVGDETTQDTGSTRVRIDVKRELERRDDDIAMATYAKIVEIGSVPPTEPHGVLKPCLSIDVWRAPQYVVRRQQRFQPLAVARVQRLDEI